MHLKIITHEKVVFDEDVDEIYTKGVNGEFGILKGHIPFATPIEIGITRVMQNGKMKTFATMGGIFKFMNEAGLILTENAESAEEIDVTRAQQALERAQARLANISEEIDVIRAQAAIARAMARLKAKANSCL